TTIGSEYFGVRAPTSGYGGMYMETTGATGRPFYGYALNGSNPAWHYLDGTTGDWRLYNNGDRLTVSSSGLVGIGTTSPQVPLHVRIGGASGLIANGGSVAAFEGATG